MMSYEYSQETAGVRPRSSLRAHFVESTGIAWATFWMRTWWSVAELRTILKSPVSWLKAKGRGGFRRSISRAASIVNGLVLIWLFTLWWGERTVFRDTVSSCAWETWETWPRNATPHHVVFVADPQLVDPHTYPGRPWPLSTLTVRYTDQYLRRAFSMIQRTLAPDTVFFLGDLFDGGREWATATSSSPDKQYKRYGDNFWRKEYARFVRIFIDTWNEGGSQLAVNRHGRKLIASLPGNHDLGFGNGVQLPVRSRFQAFFGHGNRVDVVGNHSFVSIDTVSLSAMDQPNPQTGSSGTGAGDDTPTSDAGIWRPTKDFLDKVRAHKARRVLEALRAWKNQTEGTLFHSGVYKAEEQPAIYQTDQPEDFEFPTVLLTHVPLYRKPATPCGPLRERYPPSSTDPYPEEDEQNALKIHSGYQYQNVLTPAISNELISKVGPELVHIYSGDDHDYCEVVHREYTGSPKEITVKSFSWAMGVRRPGFLLTSLWNPVDPDTGKPIQGPRSSPTVQNHLCLLPDQLGVFTWYAYLLVLTLVVFFIRAIYLVFFYPEAISTAPRAQDTLPYTEPRYYKRLHQRSGSKSTSTNLSGPISSSTNSTGMRFLLSRGALNPYGNDSESNNSNGFRQAPNPVSSASESNDNSGGNDCDDHDDSGDDANGQLRSQRHHWKRKKASKLLASSQKPQRRGCFGVVTTDYFSIKTPTVIDLALGEFFRSVRYVAIVTGFVYFFLIWTW